MAIHSDYAGLKAEIVVAGEVLQEYDDDGQPQPKITTRYIEASSGKHFTLRYSIPRSLFKFYGVKTTVRIDGEDKCKKLWFHTNCKGRGVQNVQIHTSAAVVDGKYMDQAFVFSELSMRKYDTLKCAWLYTYLLHR